MRCKACNKVLSQEEAARTNPKTKLPEDLCTQCLRTVATEVDMRHLEYIGDVVGYSDCV